MSAGWVRSVVSVGVVVASAVVGAARAGIVTDGSVGPRVRFEGDVEIGADLSTRAGRNLFHTSQSEAAGRAGSVLVQADRIELRDGGGIQALSQADGGGPAGEVTIKATGRLLIHGGVITVQSAAAGGGAIRLEVGDLIVLEDDSAVVTSVAGGADPTAGNIIIDPEILLIDGSRIQANAPVGFGGNVTIEADHILVPGGDFATLLARGVISASGGDPARAGTVLVNAPEVDLTGGLVALASGVVDTAPLRARCATRRDVGASSFTGAGRAGLAPGPDAPLASAYAAAGPEGVTVPAASLRHAAPPLPCPPSD